MSLMIPPTSETHLILIIRAMSATPRFLPRGRHICQPPGYRRPATAGSSPGGGERKAGASRAPYDPAMNEDEDELDLSTLRPNFRAWLIKTADMNVDRFEAVHGDQAASIALIAERPIAEISW
jgi:hypothetical protein